MAVLLIHPYQEFFDDNGNPLSGGKVYTYQAGTTTPKATFTDNTETVQAANPVILDSAGRATMWGAGTYKFAVYDANDVLIHTTDNVATYTTADALGNSYFEAFSGNGTQTAFTTSQNLGTDENAIMVFVADGLEQNVANGDFATDTVWTKGTGWTIGAGVATATGAISTALSQTSAVTIIAGQSYNLIYTVTRSAGGIIPSIGGVNGTERTASGTYRETIIAGATQTLAFTGNAFTGTLDSISITPADAKGFDIQSPTSYTINGTTLTFSSAPPTGTGNIYVFAPSLLVASANAAAAAADASATAASNSAIAADASADATAALYDQFDDRYLGSKSSDPTLDNDGNALISGALYFNTVSNAMKVYNGTAWLVTYNPSPGDVPYTAASSSGPASLEFAEDTDNGTNKVTLSAAASLAADVVVELPSADGTLARTADLTMNNLLSGQLASGVGAIATSGSLGTVSSGTVTPLATTNGNFNHYTNNGAHTLAPPAGVCTMVLEVLNGASAGAITTSGFTKVDGTFNTTNGNKFACFITKTQNYSHLSIVALQ